MSETKSQLTPEYQRALDQSEDINTAYGEHMAEAKWELDHDSIECPTCADLDEQAGRVYDRIVVLRVCPNCGADQYDCRSVGCHEEPY